MRILEKPIGFDTAVFEGEEGLNVGIIDADLLDGGTRCPNLALLKIAGWLQQHGHRPRLLCSYGELEADLFCAGADAFDVLVCSQVFAFTRRPQVLEDLIAEGKVFYGGTGFWEINGPRLPYEVEHAMPLYTLYDEYISYQGGAGTRWDGYKKFSIGFTTRGCFRKCAFCVNRTYSRVEPHAKVEEFLDHKRPYIWLFDDNFMAAPREVFFSTLADLQATGKRFQFRQGLDIRLMTEEKAAALAECRYYGDYIFAFDHIDEPTVKATLRGLEVWRRHSKAGTKIYVLVGYDGLDARDVESAFYRVSVCLQHGCVPYIMRYDAYKKSEWRQLYILLARWCNQQRLVKRVSFREFLALPTNRRCEIPEVFAERYPEVASKYWDVKFKPAM